MTINRERLATHLMGDEGVSLKPYRCTDGRLTIGVGRNLDDKGISRAEAMAMLQSDIDDALKDARAVVGNFDELSAVRQEVLANMALNLGRTRLAGFKKMLAAVAVGDFNEASAQMLDSKWASDVKGRAVRLARAMRTGLY